LSTSTDKTLPESSLTIAVKPRYLSAFKKLGYDRKNLEKPTKPLYGFGGKRIEPVGVITLPVSFGTPQNPRTEYLTFDVVDMHYLYNAIFGR
jgi:hypothetical protein